MATDPTPLATILPGLLNYVEERRAWLIAGGSYDDLPPHLATMTVQLNKPMLDWYGYPGWRGSLRLASHLAGVRRQPTLLLCRYRLTAAATGLLAEATGIKYFLLICGMITARELEAARLAAEALSGLPLGLARAGVGTGWHGPGGSLCMTLVLDHPMGHQQERELARNPAMSGATIYSPIRRYPK